MEKKKIASKINIILIVVIIMLLLIPAIIFILKNHNEAMYLVIEKKVVEAANNCYNEKKCENKKITLNELIEKQYIEKVYDPISKELINLDSYIDLETNEFKIIK